MRSATVLTLALPLIAAFPQSPVDGATKRDNVKRWKPTQGELDGSKWNGSPDEMDGSKWNKVYWHPGPGEMDGSKWNGPPDEMDGSKWYKPASNRGSKPPAPERPAPSRPQPQPVDNKRPNEAGGNQRPTPPATFSQPAAELQPPPQGNPQRRPQVDNRWRFPQGLQPQTSQETNTQQGNQKPEMLLSNEGANDVQGTVDACVDASYMPIVDKWRSKLQKPAFTCSGSLEKNALRSSSVQTKPIPEHHLYKGTMAQIMAPGHKANFENVLVGAWICELPNQNGLDNVCQEASKGWRYDGQTGHAEAFASTKYTKIGCGLAKGLWTCDLA